MQLQVASYNVARLELGDKTVLQDHSLIIDPEDLRAHMRCGLAIASVDVAVVHPGDAVRVIHVLDAVEPRCKVAGRGRIFAGWYRRGAMLGRRPRHRNRACSQTATTCLKHIRWPRG